MTSQENYLFGIKNSNRDFSNKESWGKNQFNSSFPVALGIYMFQKGIKSVYLKTNSEGKFIRDYISVSEIYGGNPLTDDIFYSFESIFKPYNEISKGRIEGNDVVFVNKTHQREKSIEVKLTALPDESTNNKALENQSSELVVRPSTIIYLAASICIIYKNNRKRLETIFANKYDTIKNWNDPVEIKFYIDFMKQDLLKIMAENEQNQEPLIMQPIWRTLGKSPELDNNALDIFVWSNFGLSSIFLDSISNGKVVNRYERTLVWVIRMLLDFSKNNVVDFKMIIDSITLNTKNDKAFAASGIKTHKYLSGQELIFPRIKKNEIKNIILSGGQYFLSPERRFDAVLAYNGNSIFNKGENT